MNKNSYKYAGLNLIGDSHDRLTVIRKSSKGRSWWICRCECGKEVELPTYRYFEYKSCGCLEKENKRNLTTYTRTHGMSETRLYSVWCGIKDRCTNPNTEHYDRYGGRGIKICDEWLGSFESFRDWAYSAGFNDSSTGKQQSIERINVDGNYEPSNCKWASQKEQMRNTTRTTWIEYEGKQIPLSQFCEMNGINYESFVTRHLKKGIPPEQILKIWKYAHGEHDGYLTVQEASSFYGVSAESIMNWINAGSLKADKVGRHWYIPIGQTVQRRTDRDAYMRFLPGTNK